jgi:hypothetical protein
VPPLNVNIVNTSVPADVRIGAVPPAQSKFPGHVIAKAPAFTNVSVNPNAFEGGTFVNDTVPAPLNCLLKLLPNVKSIETLPPVP